VRPGQHSHHAVGYDAGDHPGDDATHHADFDITHHADFDATHHADFDATQHAAHDATDQPDRGWRRVDRAGARSWSQPDGIARLTGYPVTNGRSG
jgi:hypothetical protein